jgi:hypothetical protein
MDSFTTAGLLFPADKFDLRQRSNLIDLDRQLNKHWALGKNSILAWAAADAGLLLLVVPHYAIADYALAAQATSSQHGGPGSDPYEFIMRLLTGSRQFTSRQLENAARLLGAELAYARLRQPLSGEVTECQIIDRLVRRYSASFVPSRAVALFDIVGFSLLTPFEQMTQLNSLSHSLNSAHSKMLGQRIDMNFARSSALASNAIARRKARGRTVPLLRVAFHVGPCYEFHQAEGLNPTIHHDIVGDVTIELARMVERALPGQILVGDFEAILPVAEDSGAECIQLDSSLAALNGLVFSGEAIESIKCYLTGRAQPDGTFTIRKLAINDKHGLTRTVFNAKINIYRRSAEPILLGIEDKLLRGDDLPARTSEHIELRGKRH